ncbi:7491_t:CDS:2 [Entrophospora sp. SA101]|nr:10311_t:CDS:2 [Entrophospora sp. SA101]CAJ0765725.1 7491_t:CDS:2 [Entrophospora sp. SA101]CAJ0836281.1 17374_t:CDS:2 [Entrophospora sp. SA101]CAJ0844503.1 6483_t:CDS:2 [Entrophospora sp. SA101]
MIREAYHAGSWYTDQESLLDKELTNWLSKVPSKTKDDIPIPIPGARAIIAPHAGYSYSGQASAFAYKCIDPESVKRVFILGPSHHVYLTKCALSQCTEYITPLGNLTLDTEGNWHFDKMEKTVDEEEHSIEMHLPYTYKIFESKINSIKIVPIMVGSLSSSKEEFYGKLLAPYLADPSNLFIISSDFCADYPFSSNNNNEIHQPSSISIPIYKSIENLDREGMSIIETINHKNFVNYLQRTKNTICGRHPIGVLLAAIEALPNTSTAANTMEAVSETANSGESSLSSKIPKIRFVHYSQSSRVVNKNDSSVSYASAYVYLP